MRAELRERPLGQMLSLTFALAAEQFGGLFIILLLCNLPQIVLQAALMPDPGQLQFGASVEAVMKFYGDLAGSMTWVMLAALIPYPIVMGASVLYAAQPFLGEKRSVWWCLGQAFRRYGRMFMLLVALGLFNIIGICPGVFILLLLFASWFYVAVPVMMLEDVGWVEALQRSRALGKGRYIETLAMYLVFQYGVAFAVAPFTVLVQLALQDYYFASVVVNHFLMVVVGVIPLVAPVVAYFQLRVVKEHYDVQRLAELVGVIGEQGEVAPAR